jgi:arylsulfatase A-like enzyme
MMITIKWGFIIVGMLQWHISSEEKDWNEVANGRGNTLEFIANKKKYYQGSDIVTGCPEKNTDTVTIKTLSKPNILLILSDDEDLDRIECYGGVVHTPHINSIAENGVRFTNANVVHSICSPSRYSILTGRYYDNIQTADYLNRFPHGCASNINNFMMLKGDRDHLATVLHDNGYYTAFIGKYHLAEHVLEGSTKQWESYGLQTYPQDVDPRKDASVNEKMKANHAWWCERVKQDGFDYADAIYSSNVRSLFNDYLNLHNIEWTTDAAVQFLESRKGKEQPFFLSYNTTYPHGPMPEWNPDGGFPFSLGGDVQLTGEGFVTDRDLSGVLEGETRESVKRFLNEPGMSNRAAFAAWWDAGVGAILNTLKKTGQYENTLLIYLADHGLRDHGKSTIYENGIRVPLLIQWPAGFAGGREYNSVVGSIDLVPTIFDACGIPVPEDYLMDGVSLVPVLKGHSEPIHDALLLQMGYAHGLKTDRWKYIAVRYPENIEEQINHGIEDTGWTNPNLLQTKQPFLIMHYQLGNWSAKANPHYFARNQLFDLHNDPEEEMNLFDYLPEKVNEMKQLLEQKIKLHIPHRPFGEFNLCEHPEIFENAAGSVWHPARDNSDE